MNTYISPEAKLISLVVEQMLASSGGSNLMNMDENEVYDENF